MERDTNVVEIEQAKRATRSRIGLRMAMDLLRRQREILTLMMAERVQRLEEASDEARADVEATWDRAILRQALTVKRMAAEVERMRLAAGEAEPTRDRSAA